MNFVLLIFTCIWRNMELRVTWTFFWHSQGEKQLIREWEVSCFYPRLPQFPLEISTQKSFAILKSERTRLLQQLIFLRKDQLTRRISKFLNMNSSHLTSCMLLASTVSHKEHKYLIKFITGITNLLSFIFNMRDSRERIKYGKHLHVWVCNRGG